MRVVRSAVAASMATFVALVSHVLGGGAIPAALGILVPLVLSLSVTVLLTGKKLSLWRLSISVAASQVIFHTLFVLGTPLNSGIRVSPTLGHSMHSDVTFLPSTAAEGDMAGMMHASPTMWLSHSIAAGITIAALYRGERVLLRLRELAVHMVAWVRRKLTAGLVRPTPLPAKLALGLGWTSTSLSDGFELSPLQRRGPPVAHAV
jgi:hypothetical protein